jgi:hypothetical protein
MAETATLIAIYKFGFYVKISEHIIMRKLFLVLIVLFALFVFINASAGVAEHRNPNSEPPKRAAAVPSSADLRLR